MFLSKGGCALLCLVEMIGLFSPTPFPIRNKRKEWISFVRGLYMIDPFDQQQMQGRASRAPNPGPALQNSPQCSLSLQINMGGGGDEIVLPRALAQNDRKDPLSPSALRCFFFQNRIIQCSVACGLPFGEEREEVMGQESLVRLFEHKIFILQSHGYC